MSYTPEQIYELHKQYADRFTQLTQSGLISAFNALSNSGVYGYYPAKIDVKFPDIGDPQDFYGRLPTPPDQPELPLRPDIDDAFADIPNPRFGSAPGSIGAPPYYTSPALPQVSLRSFTAAPPVAVPIPAMPASPNFIPIPSYSLLEVGSPDKPIITDPVFDGQRPLPLSIPPADTLVARYEDEMQEHRTLLPEFAREVTDSLIRAYCPEFSALRAKVNNAVANYNGGAGIPEHIEGAIMARLYDRNAMEVQKAVDTAAATLSRKGFTLPPGALQAVINQARSAMGDAVVRGSTELATKNLELEQRYMEFILKLGADLEATILGLTNQYLQLALKMDEQAIAAAKEIVAIYVSVYNLQVMVYKALWEGYAADVNAYRARIEANTQLVQMYEAEVRAELAKAETNKAAVEVLTAAANVNRALADAYRAQIEGVLAPLEIAKTQAAVFESQARGYAAEAGAYEARWRAYSAQVDGSLGPLKAYESQAQGYTARAQSYRASVEGYSAQVSAAAETNRAIASLNESKTRIYSAEVDAVLRLFDRAIAQYGAESNVVVEQSKIEVEHWRAKANLIFQEYNAALNSTFEYARESMALFQGQLNAAINAAQGLAQASNVAGNLAGSALQGLTAMGATFVTSQN